MLDRSSIIGLISGFGLVAIAIITQGEVGAFLSLSSIMIVAGGVIASTMINYSWENIRSSFSTISEMMGAKPADLRTDIELMNHFARQVRRDGMLQLENYVNDIEDQFLKNALQLAIDGLKRDNIEGILESQIKTIEKRVEISVNVLYSMSSYAPAFGMIGTVIGMVLMLQNVSDPKSLGAGLSVALITTLYGTILANMILGPFAGKLEFLSEIDLNRKEMFRIAILSLVDGENPRIMEKKMLNFVEPRNRVEYLQYYKSNRMTKDREERLHRYWKFKQKSSWLDLRKILETG